MARVPWRSREIHKEWGRGSCNEITLRAYVTFQQTRMRSTILVRSTIHTRAVLLSIDQYMDMHQHFHNTFYVTSSRMLVLVEGNKI